MPLPITHKEFLQGKRVNDSVATPAIEKSYYPTQADIGLFRSYLTENKVNAQDSTALRAAADDFKAKKPAYEFKAWAATTYGKNAMSAMSENRELFQTATNQYKYNQQRQKNGLDLIQFHDMAFNPDLYDDDTNEYLSKYIGKNKRMPGQQDMADFNKGLSDYRTEKYAPVRYQEQYYSFLNELMPSIQKAQQEWSAQGGAQADFDWESTISKVLAQEKYLDVAKNFKKPAADPEGYDIVSAMIGANKKDNPNAFTQADLIKMYRNLTYQPAPIDPDRSVYTVAQADPQYANLTNEKDFSQYAKKGAELETQEKKEKNTAFVIEELARALDPNLTRPDLASVISDADKRRAQMTAEERDIYNYLWAKQGKAEADKYLKDLLEPLNARIADEITQGVSGNALTAIMAPIAGLDRFAQNTAQLFTKEAASPSPLQTASGQVRENIQSGAGKVAYDVGTTVGNMLPSIGISAALGGAGAPTAIAGLIGSGTLGASVGGGAYTDAMREGKSQEQSRAYAWLTGTLEGALQYAMGGVGKLGGKLLDPLFKKAGSAIAKVVGNPEALKVITAALRTPAGKMGVSAAKEFSEEYLQEVLNPVVRNITLNENNQFQPFTEEALYAGILGALTGGLFEGVDVATETVPELQQRFATASRVKQFSSQVETVGLEETASQGVVKAYADAAMQGNNTVTRQLETSVKKASAKIAEIDAELKITEAEVLASLRPTFNAIQRAQSSNSANLQSLYDKYNADFEVGKAKSAAARLKAENRAAEARDGVIEAAGMVTEKARAAAEAARVQAEQEQAQLRAAEQAKPETARQAQATKDAAEAPTRQAYGRIIQEVQNATGKNAVENASLEDISSRIKSAQQWAQQRDGLYDAMIRVLESGGQDSPAYQEAEKRYLTAQEAAGYIREQYRLAEPLMFERLQDAINGGNLDDIKAAGAAYDTVHARMSNSAVQTPENQSIMQANNTSVKGAQYGAGNDSNQVAGPAAEDAGRNSQGYSGARPMAGEVGPGGQASPGGNAAAQPVQGFERINSADDGGTGRGFTGGAERGIDSERQASVRGLQSTPEAEQAVARRAQAIQEATVTKPDIRIVNEVDAATAKKIDILEDVTGRRVFLYESNDNYSDAWTENRDIFVRTNGNADVAFAFGHETARGNKSITTAGVEAIEGIMEGNPDLLSQYEAYRSAHITSPDNADIRRELIADAYGLYMAELAGNAEIQTTLGLKESELNEIYSAFEQAELARGIDELSDVVKPAQGPKNAEYSRITFDDGYGNQLSYSMPDIKQKKNGTFYADFEVSGQKYHLEDTYKADLEDEIVRIKQESANKNAPRPALDRREALKLYRQGVTVPQYYTNGGRSAAVALNLRDIYLKNGVAQGGALPNAELQQIGQNVNRWSEHGGWWGRIAKAVGISESLGANIWYTLTAPIRVFEGIGHWRDTKQPGAEAMNTLEGDTFRNTYWAYMHEQGGLANQWMDSWRKKVVSVYDGKQSTSTLAQMLGENLISEKDAAQALYDEKSMVVRNALGTYVFNKRGQLTALSSGGHTMLFDESFYKRLQLAKKEVVRIAQNKPSGTSHEAHLTSIREAEQKYMARSRPVSVKGDISVYTAGNSITASAPNGGLLANIRNGSRPNVNNVTKLKDVLVEFYAQSLIDQNGSVTENGYKPIPERKYYFPHTKRETHGIRDFFDTLLGEDQRLPTSIAGLTSTFTPGKPFITHMLERMGDFTEYDAMRGFNKYAQAAADLIYYTPVIQRVRQLERFVRDESEGSKNSSLAYWLHGYGNVLANKKSDLDRGLENFLGREVYTVSDRLTQMFGASAVAGSASSALSNMISFLTAMPGLEQRQVGPAVRAAIQNGLAALNGQYDGFSDKIPELVRRFGGYDKILTTREQRTKHQISKILGFAFDMVDRFSVESAARAKYTELKDKGMTEREAVRRTDEFLVKNFAERSKGESPLLFNSKWLKPFAQFQLESLNQTSHFKDFNRQGIREQMDAIIDRNGGVADNVDWTKEENQVKASTPKTLWRKIYYLVLMSLWGELTRELIGRDQTFNPYGTITDLADPDKSALEKAKNIADQLPFASMITGGGRVPVAGATGETFDTLTGLIEQTTTPKDMLSELTSSLLSFVPAGGQLKKIVRGADTYKKGGHYTDSGKLRYPVGDGLDSLVQLLTFGPSAAAPRGYDWQKDVLSPTNTAAYQKATEQGFERDIAYELFLHFDKSGTKAGKLTSIASFDADKDGTPDLSTEQMRTLTQILDIKMPKSATVPGQAKKEADTYIKNKRKDDELTAEDREKAEALYNSWLEMLKTK